MTKHSALLGAAALAASLAAGSALAAEGTLVLYTSQPNADAQKTVDAFMAANPGVTVEWVRDGTTKIMAKLRAEIAAGQPAADVLFIADTVTMEGLRQEGRLLAHTSADVTGFDAGLYDAGKHYFSTKLITTGIVYNTSAPMAPTSWKDLTRPEAKGQVVMPSPLTSGAALIHAATLADMPEFGWDYIEALAANEAQAQGGNGGVLTAVAGGEKLYGVIVDFLPIREAAKGSPVQFVFPTEGVSYVTEPVAILNTTKNADAARAFVDFLISDAGQRLAAEMGYMPAKAGITPPAGFPTLDQITLMPFNAGKALAEEEQNKLRFSEAFGM